MTDGFLEELEAHAEVRLGLPAANALAMLRDRWVIIGDDHDVLRALTEQLSQDPGYLEFARRILTMADSRLAAIYEGTEPFVADKAFTAADARVIERAALVALTLDADWAEPIPRILGRAAIAPRAAAVRHCPLTGPIDHVDQVIGGGVARLRVVVLSDVDRRCLRRSGRADQQEPCLADRRRAGIPRRARRLR